MIKAAACLEHDVLIRKYSWKSFGVDVVEHFIRVLPEIGEGL